MKYIGLALSTIISIYFVYHGVTEIPITSASDLTEIEGRFVDYSFKDGTGNKGQGHQYYIWIENYKNAFQVKADYLGIFRAPAFVTSVRHGDSIRFTIPKTESVKLNTEENVFVTSIDVKHTTYLNKDEVLIREKRNADSYSDYFLAGLFLVAGIVVYFRKQ